MAFNLIGCSADYTGIDAVLILLFCLSLLFSLTALITVFGTVSFTNSLYICLVSLSSLVLVVFFIHSSLALLVSAW